MNIRELFQKLMRYDEHATSIFDREEPVGRYTDMILPSRKFLARRAAALPTANAPVARALTPLSL